MRGSRPRPRRFVTLSILAGSSSYAASLKQVPDELGNSAGIHDGTGTGSKTWTTPAVKGSPVTAV